MLTSTLVAAADSGDARQPGLPGQPCSFVDSG